MRILTKHLNNIKKTILIISAIALMCLITLIGCKKQDQENYLTKENTSSKIQNLQLAQDWFLYNTNGFIPFNIKGETQNRGGNKLVFIYPDWNISQYSNCKTANTVETSIYAIQNNEIVSNKPCGSTQTCTKVNIKKSINSFSKLVIKTDNNSNKTIAFIMTVTPDENCQLSNEEIQKITYYDRATNFCGQISFHDINGNFTNAWFYENGIITKGLRAVSNNQRKQRGWVYTSTKFCWHTGYIREGVFYETNVDCHTTWDVTYLMDIDNSDHGGGSGGNTSNGGGGGSGGFLPSINFEKEFIEQPKLNCIYSNLIKTATNNYNPIVISFLANFSESATLNPGKVIFAYKNLGEGKFGTCTKDYINNKFVITINSYYNVNERSPMEIAKTLIHEILHAQLGYNQSVNFDEFIKIFRDFITIKDNTISSYNDHDLMLKYYVIPMANFLKDYESLSGNTSPFHYYESLALSGLNGGVLTENEITKINEANAYFRAKGLNCE